MLVPGLYEQITWLLAGDITVVYPWMYDKSPWMYSEVIEIMHLTRSKQWPDAPYEWIPEHTYYWRVDEVTSVLRMLVVRLHDGVTKLKPDVELGWRLKAEEYYRHPDMYKVLKTYYRVVPVKGPPIERLMSIDRYTALIDAYQKIGVEYRVRYASREEL